VIIVNFTSPLRFAEDGVPKGSLNRAARKRVLMPSAPARSALPAAPLSLNTTFGRESAHEPEDFSRA
jgi:hypothetical protein